MKHLLRTADLSPAGVTQLVERASELQRQPREGRDELAGQLVVLYLTEPSTRCRLTFATAAERLGATVVLLGPAEFVRGWTAEVEDIASVVGAAASLVVTCTDHATATRLAELVAVPVVNGRSELHHPCQSLADLLALRGAFGACDGLTVAYVGEAEPSTHSLMEACALAGVDLVVSTPHGCEPAPEVCAEVERIGARTGSRLRLTYDPRHAVVGADAVYTGPWLRMGSSDETLAVRRAALWPCGAAADLVELAAPHAVLLQSGAPHLDDQPSPEAARSLRSLARDQAANLQHTAAAVLLAAHQGGLCAADDCGLVTA